MQIRKPRQTTKYHPGVGTLKVTRVNKKVAKRRNKKILVGSILLVVVLLCICSLLRYEKFYIKTINIIGVNQTYQDDIKNDVNEILNGSYLYILPKKNIFIYPEKEIFNILNNKYTNLNNIKLLRQGLDTINIQANERTPVFYVVESGVPTNVFVDSSGFIFKDQLSDVSTFLASSTAMSETALDYNASSTNALPIDFNNSISKNINQKHFENIVLLVSRLEELGFHVFAVKIRPFDDIELQISSTGGVFRVNLEDDPIKIISNLNAIKKTEPLKSIISENRESINYLDFRFGNKVFYKLQ